MPVVRIDVGGGAAHDAFDDLERAREPIESS